MQLRNVPQENDRYCGRFKTIRTRENLKNKTKRNQQLKIYKLLDLNDTNCINSYVLFLSETKADRVPFQKINK